MLIQVMRDTSEGLRYLFQTANRVTFAISGTGHAGMEAALGNLLEPGEKVLITQAGLWGQRATDIATRYGAEVAKIVHPEGVPFTLHELETALKAEKPRVLFMVQVRVLLPYSKNLPLSLALLGNGVLR